MITNLKLRTPSPVLCLPASGLRLPTSALCLLISVLCLPAFAQGTTFTYQGRLNAGASPATGIYDVRFTIYDSTNLPGVVIAGPLTNAATGVSNGLFTVALDFGGGVFTGADRWLEIGVRTNVGGLFNPLTPRQRIGAAPYAVLAGSISGVVPGGSLSGIYTGAVTFNNPSNAFTGNGAGLTSLSADQLGSGTVPDARLAPNVARTNQVWLLAGNAGANPTNGNFLGTTDNQPLELRVKGMRVVRLEPDPRPGGGAGNIVGGFTNNYVEQPNSGANLIGSGGWINGINVIRSNTSGAFIGAGSANQIGPNLNDGVIGGGYGNAIREYNSVIGGGRSNLIQQFAEHSFIGGGENNTIAGGAGAAAHSVIGGGRQNSIQSGVTFAAIGGGALNLIQTNATAAVVAGGLNNTILAGNEYAVIGGGRGNTISDFGDYATIGGGFINTNGGFQSALAGGWRNLIGSLADHAFIGGGSGNRIIGSYLPTVASTIAGGYFNSIETNGIFSVIGGGFQNHVNADGDGCAIGGGYDNNTGGQYSTIPGGFLNQAFGKYSFAAGQQAHASHQGAFVWADSQNAGFDSTTTNQFSVRASGGVRFVTGGAGLMVDSVRAPVPQATVNDANHSNIVNVVNGSPVNFVAPGVYAATISGGGAQNYQGVSYTNSVASDIGTIAGGVGNTIQNDAAGATISGGSRNKVQPFAYNAVIAGGVDNTIQTNDAGAVIGGGQNNTIVVNSPYATIGGGYLNQAGSTANYSYYATVGGGIQNAAQSTYASIGGGGYNSVGTGSDSSTISGGYFNLIGTSSYYSAVGGGVQNALRSSFGTIGGGGYNSVSSNSDSCTISGGYGNIVSPGSFDVAIGGGSFATVGTNSYYSTIAGGRYNSIGDNSTSSTIGGGFQNLIQTNASCATIGGGSNNLIQTGARGSFIGGGASNTIAAAGSFAVIPGGYGNSVSGPYSLAAGTSAKANHNGTFVWASGNTQPFPSVDPSRFHIYASNGFSIDYSSQRTNDGGGTKWVAIGIPSSGTNTIQAWNGAKLTDGGMWQNSCDANRKTDFRAEDKSAILARVIALPVRSWRYTNETAAIRHLGPTAQDFKAAFELGTDAQSIGTVDADGVALAAIQGLHDKLEVGNRKTEARSQRSEDRLQLLEVENAELKQRLATLEKIILNRKSN